MKPLKYSNATALILLLGIWLFSGTVDACVSDEPEPEITKAELRGI